MSDVSEKFPNIDLAKERVEILNAFKGLMRATKNRSKEDTKMIRKAFDVAVDAHKDMRRKSGEPYIYHPIAVARICSEEIGLGATSVVCALLHDTVEDTHITLQDVEDLFGPKVRLIIDGLTKIPEVFDENASIQAENFRKMILTISDDIRVVLIKLADRLHNMRTLGSMVPDKQLKIASETKFLYAPLAHRLGLYSIKGELEDLAMMYTDSEVYHSIEASLKSSQDVRNRFIRRFVNPIREALQFEGYIFDIKARTKSISSIHRKMIAQGIPFEEVYDIFAIRIILDTPVELEKPDAWRVYSIITDFYQPSPDRLRDWISTPRANGYESLHTTVMSPTGKWVEVQIRSKRMDEIAEKGLAAHYKYKESGNNNEDNKFDRWISEIRELMENHNVNAIDFVNDFKLNLFREEIYVFTPKGDLRVLPNGSTILDFAYDLHTDIGDKCIGGKVNNRLVPLSYQLQSGDQLEIITSPKQKPTEEWLRMVISARAKQKIKTSLNDERKAIAQDGKELLERKLKQFNIKFSPENITVLEKLYGLINSTELFFRIAKSKIDLTRIRELENVNGNLLLEKKNEAPKDKKEQDVYSKIDQKSDTIIVGEDFKNISYTMGKCCNPLPGDLIFGFITINDGVKIHRNSCSNAEHLMSKMAYRLVKAKWKAEELKERLAAIKLHGIDSIGIVNKLTEIISNQQSVNMKFISFETNDGLFEGRIKVLVYDTEHLVQLMGKFEQVEGVLRVERWDTNEEN
jgi:GTP pyrophosphokinase